MKLFLFERIEHASSNYHSEGGLVIVAASKEDALALIDKHNEEHERTWSDYPEIDIADDEWEDVVVYELTGDVEPHVYPFPDAGCC